MPRPNTYGLMLSKFGGFGHSSGIDSQVVNNR